MTLTTIKKISNELLSLQKIHTGLGGGDPFVLFFLGGGGGGRGGGVALKKITINK